MSTTSHAAEPTPAQYWKIAALLAALTALEVALYYIDNALDLEIWNTLILLALMVLKFVIVVAYYMHLKYEKTILSRFFTAGFVLAFGLYTIVLGAMGVIAITS